MTPERWKELKSLLNEALEMPPSERPKFLATRSVDDDLRLEVEGLLSLETQVGDFIERPAVDLKGSAADSGDRAGQRVGPYRLVEEIGRGGMGTVYRAARADDTFDKVVALKILKRGLDTDEVVRRFRAERQILAGLDHPNIARLLDGGTTDDGLPYLVMEYVEGIPLHLYCQEEELSVPERLDLFLRVCSAVQLAHRNLVVHRDLKPSNILVTPEGTPKLLDFGIAKLLDPNLSEGLMTVAGWQFLTPEYASPEQVGGGPITTAADVYSLGVLLYQLLADRRPYDLSDRSMDGLARALRAGDPPRPSTVAPSERASALRGDLDNIVLMALRIEPERRYSTVDQLSDDLHRHLDGRPVRATPDTVRYRVGKFIRRNKLPVSVAAAFVALVVGFSVVTWTFAQQAIRNGEIATAVTDTMVGLIERTDPDSSQGGELTVRAVFHEGREELKQEDFLPEQPLVRAALWQAFGRVSLALEDFDQAGEDLSNALVIRKQMLGDNSPLVAETLNLIAQQRMRTRNLEEADKNLTESLRILRKHRDSDHISILQAESNLASLHAKESVDLAESEFKNLIPRWRDNGDDYELSGVLNNLGALLNRQGRYPEAVPFLDEALRIRRRKGKKSEIATTVNLLATAQQGIGNLDQAIPLFRESIALSRELFPEGGRSTAIRLNNLSKALQGYARIKRTVQPLKEAAASLEEALAIIEPDHQQEIAIFRRNLASVLIDQEKFTEAEEVLTASLGYFRANEPDDHHAVYAEAILGSLLGEQSQFEEAESHLLMALERLQEVAGLEPTHDDVQDTRRRLSELYEAWGKPDLAARYREDIGDNGQAALASPTPEAAN